MSSFAIPLVCLIEVSRWYKLEATTFNTRIIEKTVADTNRESESRNTKRRVSHV